MPLTNVEKKDKTSMIADVAEEMESISMPTFDDYISALERLFVIEDIEAWSPAMTE